MKRGLPLGLPGLLLVPLCAVGRGLLFSSLVGCILAASPEPQAARIQGQIRLATHPHVPWPRKPGLQAWMREFYEPSGYQLAWSSQGVPRTQVREALDLLHRGDEQGLPLKQEALAYLEEGWKNASLQTPAETLTDLDTATTLLLLGHLSEIHEGRVDPRSLAFRSGFHPQPFVPVSLLRKGLEPGGMAQVEAQAEPAFPQYRKLKAALQHYRQLAQGPEPSPLPSGQTLRPGELFPDLPRLGQRLKQLGDLANPVLVEGTTYGEPFVQAVQRFQERHGLHADGVIGPRTWNQLNVPASHRARQLELALERLRWLPEIPEGPFLLVNIPAFVLLGFETRDDRVPPSLRMKVVVGRGRLRRARTALFSDQIRHLIFRPYWYPPKGILRRETLPAIDQDPAYLEANDLEFVPDLRQDSQALPSTLENLERLRAGEIFLRQRPGLKNPLGRVKFLFPNAYDIYLHDTPARTLFNREERDFSHGCIRVENPEALARFVLRALPEWTPEVIQSAMNGTRTLKVDLPGPVPVLIIYTTAAVNAEGVALFYEDIYHYDLRLDQALANSE